MSSRKFSKTVTVSLVALAAATGAAVLEAGTAAAAPVGTDAVSTTPGNGGPAHKVFTELPALRVLLKVANKAPAVQKVAIKVTQKVSDFHFTHQVDGQSP